MEKFKVKVTNKSEVLEIEKILSTIGMFSSNYSGFSYPKYIANNIDGVFSDYTMTDSGIDNFKLITIQELKDLVVLKRNCVDDATHICGLSKVLKLETKDYKIWDAAYNVWVDYIGSQADFRRGLKPIQKEKIVKEYLEKQADGSYKLVMRGIVGKDDDIEVPEGADIYVTVFTNGFFYKDNFKYCYHNKWVETVYCDENLEIWQKMTVLWQRHTQPEELPFLDSLPEFKHDFGASSLKDQYAEIEQVRKQTIEATLAERQAQYGCFEDVARTTGKIMEALSEVRVNGLNDLPYPHRMALYMIASKMARIVNGDYNHKDSWHDIGGYSKLIEDLL